jgi:hypothetical protein
LCRLPSQVRFPYCQSFVFLNPTFLEPGIQFKALQPSFLPPVACKGGCHLRVRCLPPGLLLQGISEGQLRAAEESDDEEWWALASVAADQHEKELLSPPTLQADETSSPLDPAEPIPNQTSAPNESGAVLISIGPLTDDLFDRFNLDDSLLPQLHILTCTVRSGKWKGTLRRAPWALSEKQASALAGAMIADVKNERYVQKQVHYISCIHTLIIINDPQPRGSTALYTILALIVAFLAGILAPFLFV